MSHQHPGGGSESRLCGMDTDRDCSFLKCSLVIWLRLWVGYGDRHRDSDGEAAKPEGTPSGHYVLDLGLNLDVDFEEEEDVKDDEENKVKEVKVAKKGVKDDRKKAEGEGTEGGKEVCER